MQFVSRPRFLAAALSSLAAILVAKAWFDSTILNSSGGQTTTVPIASATQPSLAEHRSLVRFGRDVRPLLSDRCFVCHGQDANKREADLRLDVRESATAQRDGGPVIVPGSPDTSELWRRITSKDPAVMMPPPRSTKRPLSAEEQSILRRWIADGAAYEPHWAFVPPVRPTLPVVRDTAWGRNAIDRFILARLEEAGATPSGPADARTLIRRLFLDLTGLPPTPAETDAFIADHRPDAYEQWVDKLLSTEPYRSRYAERMAVPWLDAARYADTCGIHMDAGRQIWLWRDWVLNAFRQNMRYDRFLTEQLAGDLLTDATEEQRIATGFNRNHVTTDEGGAIAEEYLVEYAVDRANTTGSVFLGLTVACARCHDHKYDPISQEEYYRFYSFFNSIEEPGLYSQTPDPNRAHEPFISIETPQQKAALAQTNSELARIRTELSAKLPEEEKAAAEFVARAISRADLTWETAQVIAATSANGATLAVQPDGSVLASGKNPDQDEHVITLRTDGRNLRAVLLEALPDKSLFQERVGRAPNGNAVLTKVTADAVSVADPSRKLPVEFVWAWADVEQAGGDFRVVNILDGRRDRGWAVDGHGREGGRVALLLTDKAVGYEGGTELQVRLRYDSPFAQHVLGRVRLSVARLPASSLAMLPTAASSWYVMDPFPTQSSDEGYKKEFGPEKDLALDPEREFDTRHKWRFGENLFDGQLNSLPPGPNVTFVGRHVFSPTARTATLSLGGGDGFVLFVNGKRAAAAEAKRVPAADQDRAKIDLQEGSNTLVMKVVNGAGSGGFYYRELASPDELAGDLVAALIPRHSPALKGRLLQSWRSVYQPGYQERQKQIADLEKRIADIAAKKPRTMVMKELPQPRPTFVLTRGQYDAPDKNRPVTRGVPAVLGELPPDAPKNRLGLARWMLAPENPLVARVEVNRLWEMLFGVGLERTSEDFGRQGEWPSHPELLDWLAVEFREGGWDVQQMLKLMVTSSTYRQASRARPELRRQDVDNRLLAYYPRRRLAAEFVRDQALYISGLLVERLGGPSVKPYQPDGLWPEVAMVQSNTREYIRGAGEDLWRRSLYTYWKRACPPPSLMTFDAPTRESCTIRRTTTNTPLQALVLWNDEQFVEAARVLAQHTLRETGNDDARLSTMFRQCTGRPPDAAELKAMRDTLQAFRDRYLTKPDDAASLLKVGEAPRDKDLEPTELAAWTMIGNAMLNLSATNTQR